MRTTRPSIEALARLYRRLDRLEEAADVLGRLLSSSDAGDLPRRAQELAELYEKLGDSEKACRALERVLDAGQAGPELVQRLQRLYEKDENWSRLAELLVRESELAGVADEKTRLLSRAAGLYAERLDEKGTAATLLQRATQLKPDDRALLLTALRPAQCVGAQPRGSGDAATDRRVVRWPTQQGARRNPPPSAPRRIALRAATRMRSGSWIRLSGSSRATWAFSRSSASWRSRWTT